ncbi:MAG: LON peptidase substrate-binding domain-containing protein [Owenweeksia sp.]
MEYKESHIALFPLNIFLLPGDYAQLYIFEDKYKQLVKDSITGRMNFGIAFSNRMNDKNLGTLVEISEVIKKHPGGEMDIMVHALSIFQLEKFYFQKEGKLYPEGKIREFGLIQNYKAGSGLLREFRNYLMTNHLYNSELLSKQNIGLFDVANEMFMSDHEKMDLVYLNDQEKMEQYLRNYIRYLELLQEQEKYVYQNIYLN